MTKYSHIMELPKSTSNNVVLNTLLSAIGDCEGHEALALSLLTQWAIKNKKYVMYYDFISRYSGEARDVMIRSLENEHYVVAIFSNTGSPIFGVVSTLTGVSIIESKSGIQLLHRVD